MSEMKDKEKKIALLINQIVYRYSTYINDDRPGTDYHTEQHTRSLTHQSIYNQIMDYMNSNIRHLCGLDDYYRLCTDGKGDKGTFIINESNFVDYFLGNEGYVKFNNKNVSPMKLKKHISMGLFRKLFGTCAKPKGSGSKQNSKKKRKKKKNKEKAVEIETIKDQVDKSNKLKPEIVNLAISDSDNEIDAHEPPKKKRKREVVHLSDVSDNAEDCDTTEDSDINNGFTENTTTQPHINQHYQSTQNNFALGLATVQYFIPKEYQVKPPPMPSLEHDNDL